VKIVQGLDEKHINTPTCGDYNLPNVLAAVATGKLFNVPKARSKMQIENISPI